MKKYISEYSDIIVLFEKLHSVWIKEIYKYLESAPTQPIYWYNIVGQVDNDVVVTFERDIRDYDEAQKILLKIVEEFQ